MKTIWKFPLPVARSQVVQLPRGASILTVQMQGDVPQLWAICDPDQPKEARDIAIVGTGHDMFEGGGQYIGTFQMAGGAFAWHAFELVPE